MPLRAEAGDNYVEEVELDSRFAAVDDNEVSSSSLSYAYGASDSAGAAVARFLLPLLYLLAAFLLLLATSGRAGAVSEAMGFGPKNVLRREADLVGNVTRHLAKETAPLLASLGENAALLAAVGGDLDALLAKAGELEAEQAAVAGRFGEAHRKVDALLQQRKPVEPEALRAFVKTATVDMQRLKGSAAELEGLMRGKLGDFAAILTDPELTPPPGASEDEEVGRSVGR